MTQVAAKSDAHIQLDVIKELSWDTHVEQTDVGVEVDDGIVTLTGTVDNYAARMAAQLAAHRVNGVLDVVNNIDIHPRGDGERTDTEIAADVRHALERDVFIPSDQIRTTVSNGMVVLEGDVAVLRQRHDAENAMFRIPGVVGVINRITIASPDVPATEIREAIEQALERQAEREAQRIRIKVQDGVATQGGEVRSWREKRAVLGIASHAPGVRTLVDHLVIAPYT
jgi:osmotically-inducible protein OsmY